MVGFFREEAEKSPARGVAGIVAVGLGGPVDPFALALQNGAGFVYRPDKLGHRYLLQLLGVLFVDLQGLQNLQHQLLGGAGGVKIPGRDDARHDDHLLEQVLRFGDLPQHGDLGSAAGLAEDSDVLRVAAKGCDIFLHPAESLHQVGHAHVHRIPILFAEVGHIQIAEGVEPVVYRDHHHAVFFRQVEAVVGHLLDGGAGGIPAPVNPEQHRLFGGRVTGVGPDVQVLAVFRAGPEPVGDHHLAGGHGLGEHRADHPIAARVLYPLPGGDGLGHLEALGLGVADAVEVVHPVVAETTQLAFPGLHNGGCFVHHKFFHSSTSQTKFGCI